MKEEKMLIKQESKNILKKVIDFIRNMFWNKKKESIENKEMACTPNHSIIDDFQKENELLQLQKDYEDGKIMEKDLSEEQKNNLAKLYQKQIEDLKKDIQAYQMKLQSYKEKIINIKNNS